MDAEATTLSSSKWPQQALWSAGHSAWFLQSAHLIDYNTIHAPQLDWQYRQEMLLALTNKRSSSSFQWDVSLAPAWLTFIHQRRVLHRFNDDAGVRTEEEDDASLSIPLGLSIIPYARRDMLKEVAHVQTPQPITLVHNTTTPSSSSKLNHHSMTMAETWCARAHALWQNDGDNAAATTHSSASQHQHIQLLTKEEHTHGTTLGRVIQQLAVRYNDKKNDIRQALVSSIFTRQILAGKFGYAHVRCGLILIGNEKSGATADDWWLMPLARLIQTTNSGSHKGVLEQLWLHANFISRSVLGSHLGVHERILARLVVCWVKLHYLLFQQHIFEAIDDDLLRNPDRWLNVYTVDDDEEDDENVMAAASSSSDASLQSESLPQYSSSPIHFHNRLVGALVNNATALSSSQRRQQQAQHRANVLSALCRRVQTYLVWWWSAFDVTAMLSGQQQQQAVNTSSTFSSPSNRWALKTRTIHDIFQTVNMWLMRDDPEDL